jgi:hypothetical protein
VPVAQIFFQLFQVGHGKIIDSRGAA